MQEATAVPLQAVPDIQQEFIQAQIGVDRAAPPPWCQSNPKSLVVIDMDYFTLSGPHIKWEGETLIYMC